MFAVYACDPGRNIFALTLLMLVILFALFPILYNEDWTIIMIATKLMNTFITSVLMAIMMMLFTYVTRLRIKMSHAMSEHLNLFDGMHEGLIVLA